MCFSPHSVFLMRLSGGGFNLIVNITNEWQTNLSVILLYLGWGGGAGGAQEADDLLGAGPKLQNGTALHS